MALHVVVICVYCHLSLISDSHPNTSSSSNMCSLLTAHYAAILALPTQCYHQESFVLNVDLPMHFSQLRLQTIRIRGIKVATISRRSMPPVAQFINTTPSTADRTETWWACSVSFVFTPNTYNSGPRPNAYWALAIHYHSLSRILSSKPAQNVFATTFAPVCGILTFSIRSETLSKDLVHCVRFFAERFLLCAASSTWYLTFHANHTQVLPATFL